jgi:formylglycine-generating enzyme required for sulfatase activity
MHKHTVFISYSRKDVDIAKQLAQDLEKADLEVWWDISDLKGGDAWIRTIQAALKASKYCVVLLSPEAVESEWVEKEYTFAMGLGLKIIPILHKNCEVPMALANIQYIDFRGKRYERGLQELSEILRVLAPDEEEARSVPTPAKPRRLVNWERVGAIAGVIAVLIALGAWLAPSVTNLLSTWLSKTPTPSAPPGMVYVPAGEFIMGSDEGDSDERPVHTVYLDAFYIDKTEVTNTQFAKFLNEQGNQEEGGVTWLNIGDKDCLISQSEGQYQPKGGYGNHPVIEVSWCGARAYCQWVGKRLPTEAEWEKVARGTDGRTYPWGEGIDCDRAQYGGCGGERTTPAGNKPKGASPYGALDMAGNVWEWVADWYDSGYYSQSPGGNPLGPNSGVSRVLRGGSWFNYQRSARCASRHSLNPWDEDYHVGFRCAKDSQ